MPKPRRRHTWRRVLTNPVIAAEVAFAAVVTTIGIVALSPVGNRISLAIATSDNPALLSAFVAGLTIIVTAVLVGVSSIAMQILARRSSRTS